MNFSSSHFEREGNILRSEPGGAFLKVQGNGERADRIGERGFGAVGIGIENARSSPPFGEGKVILFSVKSMQSRGIRVSLSLQPVCRAI